MIRSFTKGMALAEIVIGAAIMSIGILAINTSYSTYVQYALANQKNIEAGTLLEEGLEVITFLRNGAWTNLSNLSTTTTYYIAFTNSNWTATTSPQYVDSLFLRSVAVADVKRDSTDDIASAGTYDANTKKVTVTVSYWQGHSTTTRAISAYLTNI